MRGVWLALLLFLPTACVVSQRAVDTELLRRRLKAEVDLEIFRSMTALRERLHRTIDEALDGVGRTATDPQDHHAPSVRGATGTVNDQRGRLEAEQRRVAAELARLREEEPAGANLTAPLLWKPEIAERSAPPTQKELRFPASRWGVVTIALTAEERARIGVAEGIGRRITSVVPGSPLAAKASVGDVLLLARPVEGGVGSWRVRFLPAGAEDRKTVFVTVPEVVQGGPPIRTDAERKSLIDRMMKDALGGVVGEGAQLLPVPRKPANPRAPTKKR